MGRTRLTRRILTGALLLAMVVLAIIAFRSGREIVTRLDEYAEARTEYASLREQFGVPSDTADSESETEVADTAETEGIDFDALRAINPNVVGWIVVPGTQISYPVVQGADNAWYLRHTFSGERNASGAIFMDYRNRADFSDNQTILHGHNMRDGSMFAPLHGWAGDRFVIHTPDGVLEFEVFNCQAVPATGEIFQLRDTEDGVRTVTLSTCISGSPGLRFVVQGQ